MINKKMNVYSTTRDEKNLDIALKSLSRAIPEAPIDAMSDYAKALRFLRQVKDPRIQPLASDIEDVYAYPERQTHNSAVANLHDFRETLHEEKLEKELSQKEAESNLKRGIKLTGLGGFPSEVSLPSALLFAVAAWGVYYRVERGRWPLTGA